MVDTLECGENAQLFFSCAFRHLVVNQVFSFVVSVCVGREIAGSRSYGTEAFVAASLVLRTADDTGVMREAFLHAATERINDGFCPHESGEGSWTVVGAWPVGVWLVLSSGDVLSRVFWQSDGCVYAGNTVSRLVMCWARSFGHGQDENRSLHLGTA